MFWVTSFSYRFFLFQNYWKQNTVSELLRLSSFEYRGWLLIVTIHILGGFFILLLSLFLVFDWLNYLVFWFLRWERMMKMVLTIKISSQWWNEVDCSLICFISFMKLDILMIIWISFIEVETILCDFVIMSVLQQSYIYH